MKVSSYDDDSQAKSIISVEPISTISTKRRGSVPHVVRVQSLPYSPDRIRNKGSPVKTPPAAPLLEEAPTTTAPQSRKNVKKGRRKLVLADDEAVPLKLTLLAKSTSKSRKRKLEDAPSEALPLEEMPTTSKNSKKVLNVKFEDDRPKKKAKTKAAPRLANSPQRLSSIPVEVCIETLGTTTQDVPKKRGRPFKKEGTKKPKLIIPEITISNRKKSVKERLNKVVEEPILDPNTAENELRPAIKSLRTTRSCEARATRSMDWSWEKVLLTNPDKISKKKI